MDTLSLSLSRPLDIRSQIRRGEIDRLNNNNFNIDINNNDDDDVM